MGKDIDRNITRQLWEGSKNNFTRNDVIPVENGGTGSSNLSSLIPTITNNSDIGKRIQNNYKNEKIDSIVRGSVVINTNSFYIDLSGSYNLSNIIANEQLVVAVFKNTGFYPKTKCSCVYNSNNAICSIDNGTITISLKMYQNQTKLNATDLKGFISFPV